MNSLLLRKYVNNLDNEGMDRLVSFLNLPMVSSLAANTGLPVIGIAAKAVLSRNLIKSRLPRKN